MTTGSYSNGTKEKLEDIQTPDDIEMLYRRHLITNPIIQSFYQIAKHHGMSEVQMLKMMVVLFSELQDEKIKQIYSDLMNKPFTYSFQLNEKRELP